MSDDRLCWMSAADLAAAIARRKVSPVEVVDAVLDRIARLKDLNAWCLLDADGARREARAAERATGKRSARLGPLHGVPFGVKDLVATKGMRTTFGTPLYRDNVPAEDAPSVARLKEAGAILLGKTTRRRSAGSASPTTCSSAPRATRGAAPTRRAARRAAP